jgi:phosphatidate cytidylyltransferase
VSDEDVPRNPAEGVRIIGAEEAQAALDAGQAAGRRPEDEPRFGDVPESPAGPRPSLRFPLPDSVEATEVAPGGSVSDPPTGPTPAAAPELPHWTERTGETPRVGADGLPEEGEEDLKAWSSFAASGPRWREEGDDWQDADYDVSDLADDGTRVGALDNSRAEHSDMFSFDDPVTADEPVDAPSQPNLRSIRTRPRAEAPASSGGVGPYDGGARASSAGGRDLGTAVLVGVGLAVVVLVAAKIGPAALAVVATVVLVAAAVELFTAFRQRGYQAATLLALVATAAMSGAAYWRGESAFPLVMALVTVFTMLWYLAGVQRQMPVTNMGLTLLGFAYVGFLGSFATLLLTLPHGVSMFLAPVIVTVANDVGAFFAGSRLGHTPLAPAISPNKTVEGYLGGATLTIIVALGIVTQMPGWNGTHAFALGVVVGVVAAPLGDLCESLIKRDLGIKDMGSILPGHGGVMDRIDALLFVMPAAYYLARALKFG